VPFGFASFLNATENQVMSANTQGGSGKGQSGDNNQRTRAAGDNQAAGKGGAQGNSGTVQGGNKTGASTGGKGGGGQGGNEGGKSGGGRSGGGHG